MSIWERVQRRLGNLADELVEEYRAQLSQASDLLRAGKARDAIDILDAILKAKPDHGPAMILLGEARLSVREPQAARDAFQDAVSLRPNDPAALVGLGLALVILGQFDQALSPLNRAVNEAAGDRGILADAYRGLGIAWRRLGDLDKAIRELRKAVTEDGDDLDARASLGEAIVADGGAPSAGERVGESSPVWKAEALRHLERAAAAEPAPALAHYGLARVALLEDSPAIASDRLAKARALLEGDPTPLAAMRRFDVITAQGDAALSARDAMAAHAFFLEALQLDHTASPSGDAASERSLLNGPKRALLHARVAEAHRLIGNLDAALQSFERALGLGAGTPVLKAAVDTAIAAGDATRGAAWSSDLLAKDPDDRRAVVARAMSMVAAQPDAAKALFEVAAQRDDVDAHVALARLALAADPRAAATAALAALRVDPHHAQARQILTEARSALYPAPHSDIADVARTLERILEGRRELGHHVGEVSRAAANLDAPLLVTVMGEFSSGKSSFVNAFIGADVAPTGITPTTATINVVRYGRERGGRLVGRDGTVTELGWDDLMKRLKALSPAEAKGLDRVEILVPLPQLEKINIVDTPGLNSIQPEHEATARAFIARADAVVWVFTAAQGGKASEKKALASIAEEGKRVLGVLNKADQLSAEDTTEVVTFIGGELGPLVEAIVPVSARQAGQDPATGNWPALVQALEERFFRQARQLKRDACARVLKQVSGEAATWVDRAQARATAAAEAARAGRDELAASARELSTAGVLAERKALSDATAGLFRRAAREVLDLVRPRRLPFSSHTATSADRDYLIALLSSGFDAAIDAGRRRVADDLLARSRRADLAARALGEVLGVDVAGDLKRTANDRIGLAMSRVFDRARAYLHGFLDGGYVEAFFRNDVPRLELAEDAVYHALVRGAPDLDRELGDPLARAATDTLTALAERLAHWGAVVDVQAFDLEVGIGRALERVVTAIDRVV